MTGFAIPGVELRVLDSDGKDVPHDGTTMGEIVARGDVRNGRVLAPARGHTHGHVERLVPHW